MKTIISLYCLSHLMVGCSMQGEPNGADDQATTQKDVLDSYNINKIGNIHFKEFVLKFQQKRNPFNIAPLISRDFDFDRVEIQRHWAIMYLCGGDSSRIRQPEGGIYQFYYGFVFPSRGDFITLFYLRPSYDSFSDYLLATFDLEGNLINDLFVAGTLTDEAQMEAYLADSTVVTTELLYNIIDSKSIEVEAVRTDRFYSISKEGIIKLIGEKNLGQATYIMNEEHGFRLELKK